MTDRHDRTVTRRPLTRVERRALAAVCDAVVPAGGAVPEGALDLAIPEELERWLAGFSAQARLAVRAMLVGFDLTPLLSRHVRPFHRLDADRRERWIEATGQARLRARSDALAGLRTLVELAYASHPRVAEAVGYDGTPLRPLLHAPAPPPLAVHTGADVPRVADADVVIVGSGAGGAVAADTLARAGLRVLVLEEGRAYDAAAEASQRPVDRLLGLYRDNGLTFALGSPVISLPMGRAVGGTTVVNSGTCFRTPDDVLHAWSRYGIPAIAPDDLAPVFDEVEAVLGVEPVPDDVLGANGEVVRRGAEALGWSGGPIRRNIRGCHGHGTCGFGCPIDAKQAMHVSYLPRAVEAGATVMAGVRVREITTERGRATGVVADVLDLSDPGGRRVHHELRVRARAVVLAAGAVFTPALLLRNKLADGSRQLGRNLVIHPGAGTSARFDDELVAWKGTMQSWYVDQHLSRGVLLEATFPPPGLGYSAGSLPGWGRDKELFRLYPHMASLGSICSDAGNGRVRPFGKHGATVRYALSRDDAAKVVEGIAASAELFFAAGARTVYPMLPGLPAISSPGDVERIRTGRWKRSRLHVSAYHPMGTARMGTDAFRSVVDAFGQTWDVPGLWVLDASILPSSTHVNPQITIMALAARGATRLADTLS